MKKMIGLMLMAAMMTSGVTRVALAGQWPTAYLYCGTVAGPGPVLIRPAAWVGGSCFVFFPGAGRVYGVWQFA